MTPKIPPGYDGRTSWMAFEEMVLDWEDITVLDREKRGPALKGRLNGEAAIFKPMLEREKLKRADGVDYFLSTLRPEFVKGAQAIFLYRFFGFLRLRRGRMDITRWIARFQLHKKRLKDAWSDMYQALTGTESNYDAKQSEAATGLGVRIDRLATLIERVAKTNE